MMSKTFGVAVIGCGAMGGNHAASWNAREDCALVAVYDPDSQRAQAMVQQYGIQACESWQSAIARPDVHLVSVCTPVCHHAEISIFAAKAGKHVLCEKPIALTLEDGHAMKTAAQKAGVHLGISYQYRGLNVYRCYRDLLTSGRVRGPVMMRFTDMREVRPKLAMHRRSMNGGPLIDMAGHYFDLVRFITGADPQSVFASGHVFGRGKERLASIPETDLAVDAAEIQVRYGDGHVASMLVHWGLPEKSRGYSNEVMVTADAVVRPDPEQGLVLTSGAETAAFALEPDPPVPAVYTEALAEAAAGGFFAGVSADDGCYALAVSLAALKSIKTGKEVAINL